MRHSTDVAHGDQFTNHGRQHSQSFGKREKIILMVSASFLFSYFCAVLSTLRNKSQHNLRADAMYPIREAAGKQN